jgi:hypothetical protein
MQAHIRSFISGRDKDRLLLVVNKKKRSLVTLRKRNSPIRFEMR